MRSPRGLWRRWTSGSGRCTPSEDAPETCCWWPHPAGVPSAAPQAEAPVPVAHVRAASAAAASEMVAAEAATHAPPQALEHATVLPQPLQRSEELLMKMLAASLSCCCSTCTAAYQLCIPSSPAPKGISDTPSHCATDLTRRPLRNRADRDVPAQSTTLADRSCVCPCARAAMGRSAKVPLALAWRATAMECVAETGARRRVGGRSTTRSRDR